MTQLGLFSAAKIFLPDVLVDYFDLASHRIDSDGIHFYFEEVNQLPKEYKKGEAISKGFYKEITIQDFPLRGKEVYLHIKRRRWQDKTTGKIVTRNWDLVAKGTRITKEFADFLKSDD